MQLTGLLLTAGGAWACTIGLVLCMCQAAARGSRCLVEIGPELAARDVESDEEKRVTPRSHASPVPGLSAPVFTP
jgi:hypothetical protein